MMLSSLPYWEYMEIFNLGPLQHHTIWFAVFAMGSGYQNHHIDIGRSQDFRTVFERAVRPGKAKTKISIQEVLVRD